MDSLGLVPGEVVEEIPREVDRDCDVTALPALMDEALLEVAGGGEIAQVVVSQAWSPRLTSV